MPNKNSPTDGAEKRATAIEPSSQMLELLVCPMTHVLLEYDAENSELVSKAAGLAYPVRDGIPLMLPSEARRLEAD